MFAFFITACTNAYSGETANTPTVDNRDINLGKEIRQALAAAVDREAIASQSIEKLVLPAYHFVPNNYPHPGEPFLEKYGLRNLNYARRLLGEGGYTANHRLEIELWYPLEPGDSSLESMLQIIKSQIEETGLVTVKLRALPRFEYQEKVSAGELPVFIKVWNPVIVDPLPSLEAFATCGEKLYCSSEMERLIREVENPTKTKPVDQIINEINPLYAEEVPAIPLFWEQEPIAYAAGVEGIRIGVANTLDYKEIIFDEQAQPASGVFDTLILGTAEELTSLDSANAHTRHDREILANIGLPLLIYQAGTAALEYGTVLTFPIVSEDRLSYSFFLREDIRFADGTPLRADMYVDHWHRLSTLEGEIPSEFRTVIDRVETVNDLSFIVHLKRPAEILPALAADTAMIVSNPSQFSLNETVEFPAEIDGLGAYRMASHQPGYEMILAANPHSVYGVPGIPNVVIRYYDGPDQLCDAMEKGEVDIAWGGLGAREKKRLQNMTGVQTDLVLKPTLITLSFGFLNNTSGQ